MVLVSTLQVYLQRSEIFAPPVVILVPVDILDGQRFVLGAQDGAVSPPQQSVQEMSSYFLCFGIRVLEPRLRIRLDERRRGFRVSFNWNCN